MKMRNSTTPYVIFLAVVAAIGGILFGYDAAVISGTTSAVSAQFGLDTMQEGWYVGCALLGSIFGVMVAGMLSDGLGRKLTMLISAILFSVSAIGCAICGNFSQLVVYRIIGGVGIGIISIVSPIYIAEVASPEKRGSMVALYQLAITIGFLLAYMVNYAIVRGMDSVVTYNSHTMQVLMKDEFWRGMLGSETLPDLLFLIVVFFIPESPRWLMTKGRSEQASAILSRMYTSDEEVRKQLALTGDSLKNKDASEWKELLKPGILFAVVIGCAIAILGQFMGVNAVLYYGPRIFADAGLSGEDSMFSQVLVGVVNMLTTVIALIIIDRVGRKKLVYWGVSGMILSLIMIGTYFKFGDALGLGKIFLLFFFLFYIFCTAISICAVVFVLLSEMYPNRVRGMAMSIAGLALWLGTYLIGQLTPWLLEHLTPAGTFFLFAIMCVPYIYIMWKFVPETTGKTLEEIETYWTGKRK